jgi:hypothetical protein
MISKSKFALVAALAAFAVASPAFGQAFNPAWGTGNVQAFSYGVNGSKAPSVGTSPQNPIVPGESGQFRTAGRNEGLGAYAMVPRSRSALAPKRPIYDYSPGFGGGYGSGSSGYDPSIATQR